MISKFDNPKLNRKLCAEDQRLADFRQVAGQGHRELVAFGKSAATWRQYASHKRSFEKWCDEHGRRALPADVETVGDYLEAMEQSGFSVSTIHVALSALSVWHDLRGHVLDRRAQRHALKSIRRKGAPARRAKPLRIEDMQEMLRLLDERRIADIRDGALIAVGVTFGLRRSELIGLDWLRCGSTTGATGLIRHRGGRIEIELMRSKTSQEAVVELSRPEALSPAAARWLDLWAATAKLRAAEPVFRVLSNPGRKEAPAITSQRLSDHAAAQIVKNRIIDLEVSRGRSREEAIVYAQDFSGHSMRRGLCTSLAVKGVPEHAIRQVSRHKSPIVFAGYVEAKQAEIEEALAKVEI
jgi:integrase